MILGTLGAGHWGQSLCPLSAWLGGPGRVERHHHRGTGSGSEPEGFEVPAYQGGH